MATQVNPLGCDIYFDLESGSGPNTVVTPSGDWKLVSGRECLRQWLIRGYLTTPGSWKTKPKFGAGIKAMLRKKMTSTTRATAIANIKAFSLSTPRIKSVDSVEIERLVINGVAKRGWHISVVVTPAAEPEPLPVEFDVLED